MTRTLIFTDGFETGLYSAPQPKWTTDNFGGTGTGRFGADTAWNCGGTAYSPSKGFGASYQGLHVGMGFKKTIISSSDYVIRLYDSAALHIALYVLSTGKLAAYRSGTLLAESGDGQVISADTWGHLEFRVWIADSPNGRVTVKWNGTTFIDFTGDTRNAANASVNTLNFNNASNVGQIWFDDLNVWSITDFTNDAWVGDVRIFTKLPDGAGNYAQWTPSAGSNYQNVDEADPDDDTTYNSSSTASQLDSFAFPDISGTGTVVGVVSWLIARKDDAGARVIAHLLRRSSDSVGPDVSLGDNYDISARIMETDPIASGAWTISNVNSSEFGYKMVS